MPLVDTAPRALGTDPVGPIAYGLWRFTHDDIGHAQRLLEAALDAGMNLIDTADVYGLDWGGSGFGHVESILGQVLARAPQLRDRALIATKGGIRPPVPYDSSAQYLRQACEDSLRRLNLDVIDLYQIHRPDPFTHPEELASTLLELIEVGKIRHVGISNYSPTQYDAIRAALPFRLATIQPEFSVLKLDPMRDGTLDKAIADQVLPLAWSPLGGGRLFREPVDAPSLALQQTLDRLADTNSVDRAAVALAFVLAHPSRPVPIIGTQQPTRIHSAKQALTVKLSRTDLYDVMVASDGEPLP